MAKILGVTLASYVTKYEGQKEVSNYNVKLKLCALEKTFSPTMTSCGRP
jgi:hypothetical protein